MKSFSAALCIFGALSASQALAGTFAWTDAESRREYLLIDEPLTRYEAENACLNQGYALWDRRFVKEEETKRLMDSGILSELNWQTLYAGTARETSISRVWQADQQGVIASNGFSYGAHALLIQKNRRGVVSATTEGWGYNDGKAQAVCMSVDTFWYTCNIEYKCTYSPNNNPYSIRYKFEDYGESEADVMRHIRETTQAPQWSVGEGQCALQTESVLCRRLLP